MLTPEKQAQSIIDQWFIDSGDVDSSFASRIDLRRRVAVALTAERGALAAEVKRLRDQAAWAQADYDACYESIKRLGRALGHEPVARPVSTSVVMDEYIAEVARLRPVVESACAYCPRIRHIEDLEVDVAAVGYERWRLLWELVRAIDAYRATEATT